MKKTAMVEITLIGMAVLVAALTATSIQAADRFKAGDTVEVLHLRKWRLGTVVQINARGEVLAEFEFITGRPQRDVFQATDVRFLHEADAVAATRTWKDTSGGFRVDAALMAIGSDEITLRKPDMTEIKVPVAALSAADQAFIKRLEQQLGPTAAGLPSLPDLEEFTKIASQIAVGIGAGNERAALAADPMPEFKKLAEGGAAFTVSDFFDDLTALLPIGGADAWVLAATNNHKPSDNLPSRLLWVSLKRKKVEGEQLLSPGEIVVDYHSSSRRLLTYARLGRPGPIGETKVMTLWEVVPTSKQATPVVRWKVDLDAIGVRTPWSRIINGNMVVQQWGRDGIVGWDVANKKMAYRIPQDSFFGAEPVMSGNGKYLIQPGDKHVRIYEAASGVLLSTLPAEGGAAAVAVSADGRKLAVLGRSTLTIWDLTDAQAEPQVHKASGIGTPFKADLSWVDDQHVMGDSNTRGVILFRLKDDLALWNYQFDSSVARPDEGKRVRHIVDGHVVFAIKVPGSVASIAVGALRLPGPNVAEASASVDVESLAVIKQGSAVRLDVRTGEHNAQVQETLTRQITDNGWRVTPDAEAVVIAEMKRGEAEQATYRFGIGPTATEQTATVTPHISTVRIELGGQVAWSSIASTGAPGALSIKEGDNLQEIVDRMQQPNVEFFGRIDIPDRILDPAKAYGLGSTQITLRGFVTE